MDLRFQPHNTHLDHPGEFRQRDPHLRRLQEQALVHRFGLLDRMPRKEPGIYSLGGGRQIGKTTLLKQWMAELLESGVAPECLRFLTGELIDDHYGLVRLLMEAVEEMPVGKLKYLLLDEVTYIRDWDKAVKYAADAGLLEQVILIATGSDLLIIREARMRFPGRRGGAEVVDFHLYPLSFGEVLALKQVLASADLAQLQEGEVHPEAEEILLGEFVSYLGHGGVLIAINDVARHGRILPSTFVTYSDWVRGDFLKRGKQEHYLREVIGGLIERYGAQLTWNALARALSIDHPATVADYVALLSSMDVALVQPALLEDRLAGAPKKARKVLFADPFIYHALRHWVKPSRNPYEEQVLPLLQDPDLTGLLAEACAVSHYSRYFPVYYIKGEGEVDLAYVDQGRFWPVEIKWTGQVRPKSLKQVAKYPNSRILAKTSGTGQILGVPVEFLPLALWRLEEGSLSPGPSA